VTKNLKKVAKELDFDRIMEHEREVNPIMPVKTVLREGENLDEALRRFKRSVNKSGILLESRKREFYLKTGLRRKMKSEMARRKKW